MRKAINNFNVYPDLVFSFKKVNKHKCSFLIKKGEMGILSMVLVSHIGSGNKGFHGVTEKPPI